MDGWDGWGLCRKQQQTGRVGPSNESGSRGVAAFIVSAHSGFVLMPGARPPASLKGMKRHAAENVNKLRMVMIIS